MSIQRNVSIVVLKEILRGIFLNKDIERKIARKYIKKLNVKVTDVEFSINSLSGGNQQKVMIGKWLCIRTQVDHHG